MDAKPKTYCNWEHVTKKLQQEINKIAEVPLPYSLGPMDRL